MACCDPNKPQNLRDKIDVLSKTSVRKAGGGRTETWTILVSPFSKLMPKNKNPYLEARDIQQQTTHKVLVRFDSSIFGSKVEDLRIRFGARFMFIKSIINMDERDRFLEIDAMEDLKAVVVVS